MKVLVYLPPSLGASLLSLPCLKSWQANFPEAEIHLLLSPSLEGLFSAILPDYHLIPVSEVKDITRLRRTANQLKKMNVDFGLLLDNSFTSALLFYLARIPERWGYDHEGRGFMLTRKLRVRATDPPIHLKDYYLNLLKKVGLRLADDSFQLTVSSPGLLRTDKLLQDFGLTSDRPIIAIKPGSSFGPARIWPVQHQAELIDRLRAELYQVILIGSAASRPVAQAIQSSLGKKVVDLTGRLELEDLPFLLTRCQALVGNDSGLTHLANFLGLPVVALYGPTDPETCGPIRQPVAILKKPAPCSPCFYKTCPYDQRCLNNIQSEEVYQALQSLLKFKSL